LGKVTKTPTHDKLQISGKGNLMKMFLAKHDRLKAPSPIGNIQIFFENHDLFACLKFSFRLSDRQKFNFNPGVPDAKTSLQGSSDTS
jgi:hypothetical protein